MHPNMRINPRAQSKEHCAGNLLVSGCQISARSISQYGLIPSYQLHHLSLNYKLSFSLSVCLSLSVSPLSLACSLLLVVCHVHHKSEYVTLQHPFCCWTSLDRLYQVLVVSGNLNCVGLNLALITDMNFNGLWLGLFVDWCSRRTSS